MTEAISDGKTVKSPSPAPVHVDAETLPAPAVEVRSRGGGVDDIVIGAGVVSTGHFVTGGLICVDGTLRDSVVRADTISISHGAELHGRAQARHVEIFGRLDGEVVATEQIVLRASAIVTGKISSPCMVMHRGATVTGEVDTTVPEGKLPTAAQVLSSD